MVYFNGFGEVYFFLDDEIGVGIGVMCFFGETDGDVGYFALVEEVSVGESDFLNEIGWSDEDCYF